MKDRARKTKPLIAIFNTTAEVIDALTYVLEEAGHNVVSAFISDFRRGKRDLIAFMEEHGPDIIIYDLPPPYAEQLAFLRIVRNMEVMKGIRFLFTTTNKRALEQEDGGKLDAHEIIGKPFDLDELLKIVDRAVEAWRKRPARG